MKKILLTGGGTGGHIYPLAAVAHELKSIGGYNFELSYIGPQTILNEEFRKLNIKVYSVISSKFRRYFSLKNIIDIPKFFLSLIQSLVQLYFIMPDLIFSKGGPGALPVVLAARFYLIPVFIHESDVVPGLTNRISVLFAKKVFLAFIGAKSYFPSSKIILVGNPIRKELLSNWLPSVEAKRNLGFDPEDNLTLVLGGSQGALTINNFVFDNLEAILGITQVYHQVGLNNLVEAEKTSSLILKKAGETFKKRYQLIGQFEAEKLRNVFCAADLVISRAGAGAIFEIAAFAKPAILIPLEGAANNHQNENAYEYSKSEAAIVIEETNLKINIVLIQIKKLLTELTRTDVMRDAARKFSKPMAAQIIAQEILNYFKG